jgi:DNA-binding IscR family transcriptional regulator
VRGPAGGYRLAKPAANITLWDVVEAIEGALPIFRCSEIRRHGPCPARGEIAMRPCAVAFAFGEAERLYQDQLKQTSVADICNRVAAASRPADAARFATWLGKNMATPG